MADLTVNGTGPNRLWTFVIAVSLVLGSTRLQTGGSTPEFHTRITMARARTSLRRRVCLARVTAYLRSRKTLLLRRPWRPMLRVGLASCAVSPSCCPWPRALPRRRAPLA